MWSSNSNEDFKMNNTNISDYRNRLMASLFAVPACQAGEADTEWFPAVDVIGAREEYLVEVDLPGLKPEEIKLSVDQDALSISGKRPRLPHDGRRVRVERPSGAFVRRLPLPPDACGEIHATFCNGVLELRVPRVHPHKAPKPAQAVAVEAPITRSSTAACGASGLEAKPSSQMTIAETQSK